MRTPGHWQTVTAKTLLLMPLSWLYRAGAWADRETSKPITAPIPVVSVGNATVGGTGKTPTTIALLPLLQELGFTPHILTRGYKAEKPLDAHRALATDTASTIGDEAVLLARHAPTWVGRDRVNAAREAAKAGATLALCDDAHQHYRLRKNLSLLVVDGPYGFGNGQLLPAGPLREPLHHAFARTDAVILIGDDPHNLANRITLPLFRARLTPGMETTALREEPLFAFAGIGRPEKFFATLHEFGANVAGTRSFPDHHTYSEADMAALQQAADSARARLITTEKDAVKLPGSLRETVLTLPVSLTFEDENAVREFLRARLT